MAAAFAEPRALRLGGVDAADAPGAERAAGDPRRCRRQAGATAANAAAALADGRLSIPGVPAALPLPQPVEAPRAAEQGARQGHPRARGAREGLRAARRRAARAAARRAARRVACGAEEAAQRGALRLARRGARVGARVPPPARQLPRRRGPGGE
eukprot:4398525-Prymnesium_polylepis.1